MKTFALYAITRQLYTHLLCTLVAPNINDAAAYLGGTLKDVTTTKGVARGCAADQMFPGLQIYGGFIVGEETAKKIVQIQHPDAPEDVLTMEHEVLWYALLGNTFLSCHLGSVPSVTIEESRGKRP